MSQESNFNADKLIEMIEQGRVKFFLEGQSVELELKVAIQRESNDSKISILGTFTGAGLDGLHTLKVKTASDTASPTGKDPDDPHGDRSGDPHGG